MAPPELPIFGVAADLVCPERCAGCDAFVDARDLFCPRCRGAIRPLGPPECARCGRSQSVADHCRPCLAADSPVRMARAFAAYDRDFDANPVASAIASFKYGGARRLGRRFAAVLLTRVPDPGIDVVVPVPLHPRRLRERGFNQSAVLARHLGRRLGRPIALQALVRARDTPSQVGLGTEARARNVAEAFAVRDPTHVAGRTVLVIDDVWTSGATARAVGSALRAAGATAVDVLTIARVL
jgi:ComF family protein